MSNISNQTPAGFNPAILYNDLKEVKDQAKTSLQHALTNLGVIIAGGAAPSANGAMPLSAPNASILGNVSDMTLRIGLLQDALNELMTQVSKLEIDKRMNEMQNNNKEELNQIKKQLKEAEEAYKQQKEANQKGNVFEMIGDWISVAFDVISIIVTVATAVAYAASGNYVAAAAMVAATAALAGSLVCNVMLAVDSTYKAATGSGFLSSQQRSDFKLAGQILGYVAMACSIIGGVAAITQGLSRAGALAGKEMTKQGIDATKTAVMKEVLGAFKDVLKSGFKEGSVEISKGFAAQVAKTAMKDAAAQGTKEVAMEAAKVAMREAVKEVIHNAIKPLMQYTAQIAVTNGVRAGVQNITAGVAGHEIADLQEAAADAQLRADEAAAKAKAISAQIAMLKGLIEQLQDELGEMMEATMNSVSAIFGAIDESQQSMENLFHTQAA